MSYDETTMHICDGCGEVMYGLGDHERARRVAGQHYGWKVFTINGVKYDACHSCSEQDVIDWQRDSEE